MIELLNPLYWREPWLLSLMLLPLALVTLNKLQQHWQWRSLADSHLQPWLHAPKTHRYPSLSMLLLTLTWLCLVIALAGPRLVKWIPPEQQALPDTLMVVLDFSASMNAQDAYPQRKAQAILWLKQALKNKPKHLKVGFIVFAGHAFELMPATLDEAIIQHFLKQLNLLSLPTLGNDLSTALSLANQALSNSKGNKQYIAVLSDGDLSPHEQQRAFLSLQQSPAQIAINFIGFGDTQGVKLPLKNGGFVMHNGRPVQSRLQAAWLQQVARLKQVSYQHYNAIKQQSLAQTLQLSPARLSQQAQQHVIWQELFIYPLILAALLFMLSVCFITPKQAQLMMSAFFVLTLSHSPNSEANNADLWQQANSALTAKQFEQAQRLFSRINTPSGAFGEGIACYRQANFNCATRAFSQAAWQTKNQTLKASAVFNLGNSYFFLGNYDQAAVLFDDAKNLGFNPKLAQKNATFANTMQHSVLQRIADIKSMYNRAKWRAAATGNPAPSLSNIISSQSNLSIKTDPSSTLFLQRKAFEQQVAQQLGIEQNASNSNNQWIKTDSIQQQSSAQLLKRLLEMQLAIPAALKAPQAIKGKRAW